MTLSTPSSSTATSRHRGSDAPVPLAVERSCLLWAAGNAVGLVAGLASVVVALVLGSSITARVVADGGDPAVAGPAAVRGVLVVGLVQIALAAVGHLVAPRLRDGRGWTRVVLTVAGIVGVGALLAAATANSHPGLTLLSAVGVLLVLLAVLYAYQPRASAWYRTLRRARNRRS